MLGIADSSTSFPVACGKYQSPRVLTSAGCLAVVAGQLHGRQAGVHDALQDLLRWDLRAIKHLRWRQETGL